MSRENSDKEVFVFKIGNNTIISGKSVPPLAETSAAPAAILRIKCNVRLDPDLLNRLPVFPGTHAAGGLARLWFRLIHAQCDRLNACFRLTWVGFVMSELLAETDTRANVGGEEHEWEVRLDSIIIEKAVRSEFERWGRGVGVTSARWLRKTNITYRWLPDGMEIGFSPSRAG